MVVPFTKTYLDNAKISKTYWSEAKWAKASFSLVCRALLRLFLWKQRGFKLASQQPSMWSHSVIDLYIKPGNTKGVPVTFCLSGLDWYVLQITTKIVSSHTADSKAVKQEVNGTVILPPLVFPDQTIHFKNWCHLLLHI